MKLGSIKPKEGKTLLRFVLENGIILLCATGRKDESNKKAGCIQKTSFTKSLCSALFYLLQKS